MFFLPLVQEKNRETVKRRQAALAVKNMQGKRS